LRLPAAPDKSNKEQRMTTAQAVRTQPTEGEARARIDLAALYRLSDHYGWSDLIYNHISARVPGEAAFLVKAHAVMFDEVCASNLVKVRLDGKDMDEKGFVDGRRINRAGFTIHSAVLNARPEVNFVLHFHGVPGMAVSALREGLRLVSQEALQFHNRLSYHDFEGVATDRSEAESLARDLGPSNRAMILRNHGVLTCSAMPSEALSKMRYLVEACEVQIALQGMGGDVLVPSPEISEHAARQFESFQALGAQDEWSAYLRIADRLDASFRN
jgi:ribulose-5-phosphate 4-epimerase/fuculose-1-phosphate aldolase